MIMNIEEVLKGTDLIQKEKEAFVLMIREDKRSEQLSLETLEKMFFMIKIAELQEEIKMIKLKQ